MFKKYIVFLVVFCGILQVCSGLLCYWCSGVGDDRECELRPNTVRRAPAFQNCSSKYCIVAKVVDRESFTAKSFARGCDNVDHGNICIKDTFTITCYQTCTTDLCNFQNPDPTTALFPPTDTYIDSRREGELVDTVRPDASVGKRFSMKDFPWNDQVEVVHQEEIVAGDEYDAFNSLRHAFKSEVSSPYIVGDMPTGSFRKYTAGYGRIRPFLKPKRPTTTPGSNTVEANKENDKRGRILTLRNRVVVGSELIPEDSQNHESGENPYIDYTERPLKIRKILIDGLTPPPRVDDENWRSSFKVISSKESHGENQSSSQARPLSPFARKDIYDKFEYLLKRHNDSNGELLRELAALGEKLGTDATEPTIELYRIIMDKSNNPMKPEGVNNGDITTKHITNREHRPPTSIISTSNGPTKPHINGIKYHKQSTKMTKTSSIRNSKRHTRNKSQKRRHVRPASALSRPSSSNVNRQYPSAYNEYHISPPTWQTFTGTVNEDEIRNKQNSEVYKGKLRSPFTRYAYMRRQPPVKLISYIKPTRPPLKTEHHSVPTFADHITDKVLANPKRLDDTTTLRTAKTIDGGLSQHRNPFTWGFYPKETTLEMTGPFSESVTDISWRKKPKGVDVKLYKSRKINKNRMMVEKQSDSLDKNRKRITRLQDPISELQQKTSSSDSITKTRAIVAKQQSVPWIPNTTSPPDNSQFSKLRTKVPSMALKSERMLNTWSKREKKLKRNIENTSTVKNVISKPVSRTQLSFLPTKKAVAMAFRNSPFSQEDFKLMDVSFTKSITDTNMEQTSITSDKPSTLHVSGSSVKSIFDKTVESRPLTREVLSDRVLKEKRPNLHRHGDVVSTKSYGLRNSGGWSTMDNLGNAIILVSVVCSLWHLIFK